MYHLPQEQSLTLHERPHIHHPPLAAYWQQHPAHRQDLVRYLAKHKAHATVNGLQMTYWRTSGDGKGRFYAQGPGSTASPQGAAAFYNLDARTSKSISLEPSMRSCAAQLTA